jgi:hypothetical protein
MIWLAAVGMSVGVGVGNTLPSGVVLIEGIECVVVSPIVGFRVVSS